jgi:hypothetical protein
MGMFVGALSVDGCNYKSYAHDENEGDSFFDNMSDSVAFGKEEDAMFGGSGGRTKNDTGTAHIEDIAAETEQYVIEVQLVEEQESKCDLDVLATGMDTPIMSTKEALNENKKAMRAIVGSVVTLGRAEEWLFKNGGATDDVTYDNKHTTD